MISINLGYPILCHPSQKRCYWAQDGQEVNTGLGIDLRVLGSAAINLNNDLLYITGGFGFTGALNSTEIHAFQEKPKIGPELPFPTSDHCLVQGIMLRDHQKGQSHAGDNRTVNSIFHVTNFFLFDQTHKQVNIICSCPYTAYFDDVKTSQTSFKFSRTIITIIYPRNETIENGTLRARLSAPDVYFLAPGLQTSNRRRIREYSHSSSQNMRHREIEI